MKAIVNGKLITPGPNGDFRVEQDKVVIFEDRILEIIDKAEFDTRDRSSFEEVYYAQGQYVSPGFINLHIHGCVGSDTMDCR